MIKPFKEVDLEGTYPLAERRGEQFYEIITKSTIMTPLLKEVDSLMAKIEGKELVGWDKEVSSVSKDVLFMVENSPKEVQDVVKAKLLEVWRESGLFEKINHFVVQREKYQNNHLHVLLEKKITNNIHKKVENNTKESPELLENDTEEEQNNTPHQMPTI